jgi:TetR/AcrR family fatty acid metabolism transcriptional regulator
MPARHAVASDSRVRGRILAAAQQRFADFGYRRTGIAEIARDAGVAAGTVYRYFENKEEVFRAVMREGLQRWLATARRVLAEPGTPLERLARLGQVSVEFNRNNSLVHSVYRRDGEIIFAPLLEELHAELVRENVAMMAAVIRDGVRDGTFADVDAEQAAFILFTGGDALSNQTLHPYDELLPLYTRIVMQGLMPR